MRFYSNTPSRVNENERIDSVSVWKLLGATCVVIVDALVQSVGRRAVFFGKGAYFTLWADEQIAMYPTFLVDGYTLS